jgi:hypothetical protein
LTVVWWVVLGRAVVVIVLFGYWSLSFWVSILWKWISSLLASKLGIFRSQQLLL